MDLWTGINALWGKISWVFSLGSSKLWAPSCMMAQGVCTGRTRTSDTKCLLNWLASYPFSSQASLGLRLKPLHSLGSFPSREWHEKSFLSVLTVALQLICTAVSPGFIVRPEILGPCVLHPQTQWSAPRQRSWDRPPIPLVWGRARIPENCTISQIT